MTARASYAASSPFRPSALPSFRTILVRLGEGTHPRFLRSARAHACPTCVYEVASRADRGQSRQAPFVGLALQADLVGFGFCDLTDERAFFGKDGPSSTSHCFVRMNRAVRGPPLARISPCSHGFPA